VVYTPSTFHDRQASSSERIGEQECAGVGPVKGDARGWKLDLSALPPLAVP